MGSKAVKRLLKPCNFLRYLSNQSKETPPSYFFQPGRIPLIYKTINDVLEKTTCEAGDDIAFISYHQNIKKSYSDFKKDVDKLASGLLSLGLTKGDRVGLCAPNIYEWPIVQFATAKVGLIMVNINPAYQVGELEYCLKKVGCKTLITSDTFKTQQYYNMLCQIAPELASCQPGSLKSEKLPLLHSVVLISQYPRSGTLTFDQLLNAGDSKSEKIAGQLENVVQADDPVNIQFTSGTTGSPKAAVLSHFNIINNIYLVCKRLGYFEQKPIACCQVPLFHCFGCVLGTLGSVLSRHTCVFPSPSFNALESLKVVEDLKCTAIYGTPTMFVDVLDRYDEKKHDISSLNKAVTGGAPCPEKITNEIYKRMNIPKIHIAYGLTETSPVISLTRLEDYPEIVTKRFASPLEHIETKIVDTHGGIVPLNTEGEIWVRGHVVFRGYWDQKDKTEEAIDSSRWFHTGDLATMTNDGYIQIIGRKKDMVIRGGENLYPLEVENFLHKHPNILEAHICGVPDSRMGEELCAWIKLKEGKTLTEEQVKLYCKGKISHFKIPRYIMFVNDFPKTTSGKIQKFKMQKISTEKLNL